MILKDIIVLPTDTILKTSRVYPSSLFTDLIIETGDKLKCYNLLDGLLGKYWIIGKGFKKYPKCIKVLTKIKPYTQKVKWPLYGELDMPNNFDISMKNVSHEIFNVRFINNNIIADIKILDTPSGKILKENLGLYEFRPRGVGKVSDTGIVSGYHIITFDAITN